jgi:predicted Rossmann fold nucleotide-binding protein DprA/Smf involved in DNA uptake
MKQIVGQIISGGQTGADRAALDFAIKHQIPHGGWCPLGRLASDGPLASQYQLIETESKGYLRRTKLNVQDSDATLIFNSGELSGGTLQTVRFAQAMNKPYRVFQLDQVEPQNVALEVHEWLSQIEVVTVNIAGPREAKRPGIYGLVMSVLEATLSDSQVE